MKNYIGIDLGSTNIAAGLVTKKGMIMYSCNLSFNKVLYDLDIEEKAILWKVEG